MTPTRKPGSRQAAPKQGRGSGTPAPAAAPSSSAESVLELQRTAGNKAVAQLVAGGEAGTAVQRFPTKPGKTAPPPTPLTEKPEIDSWGIRVKQGKTVGAGLRRTMDATSTKVFLGDTVDVHVRFKKLTAADHARFGSAMSASNNVDGAFPTWQNANTLSWELSFKDVGEKHVKFDVFWDDGQKFEWEEQFHVVSDLEDFREACQEAQSKLAAKILNATKKVDLAATAFHQAYAEQQADLDDVSASEKMINDLIFGAIFAAAGGFAGGMVGGWLKTVNDGALKNKDYVLDVAKDTVKFATRSLDKLRGGHTSTQGDSTAPSLTGGGEARGERKASGKDPLEFLTDLSAAIAGDGANANTALAALIHASREARWASSKADFEEDPLELVTKDMSLDQITAELTTEKKWYLKGLWQAWLGAYAWKAEQGSVTSNVGRKIRKKINKAAEACGETTDQWIQEFGLQSKLAAQSEADQYEDPYQYIGMP